jgi:heme-degrading monooxygenase HmoA
MYARVLKFENADPARREEFEQRVRERVLPMLKQVAGFAGYVALLDADERRATAIVLWESKEAAETAEKDLAPRREQLTGEQGLTIAGNKLLEAPIVEVRAGVTA